MYICICIYVAMSKCRNIQYGIPLIFGSEKTVIGIKKFELSSSIALDANWTIYDEDKNWFITKFKEHMHIQYLYLYIYI